MKAKLWFVMWFAALGACSSVVADAPASQREAGAPDVPAVVDAAAVVDAPAVVDARSPDAPVRESHFEAALAASSTVFAMRGGFRGEDGFTANTTFFNDGSVVSGFFPDSRLVPAGTARYELPDGAAEVLRLLRQVEADGLLDVPEGHYGVDDDDNEPITLVYLRNGRLFRWTVARWNSGPPALTLAIEALADALAPPRDPLR